MAENSLTIKFEDGSEKRVTETIARIQREMGVALPDAVKFMGWFIARSLGASTRVARKKRLLRTNKNDDRRFPKIEYPKFVHVYRPDGSRRRVYLKGDKDQIRDARARTINNRGFARRSWLKMASLLGGVASGSYQQDYGQYRRAIDNSIVTVRKGGGMIDPEFVLTNYVRYIQTAVKLGKHPLGTALNRGVSAAAKVLDKKLAKAVRR